jgi:hypothetical protein
MDSECQTEPKALRERVNNARDGKTKLKALTLEKRKKNNKKYWRIGVQEYKSWPRC